MRAYMFGFDGEHPEQCAQALRGAGFDGVVVSQADARTQDALQAAEIDLYLCFGSLSLGVMGPEHQAEDARGRFARWFGSGCPSDEALIQANLERALENLTRMPTAKGLFADGARHASFASEEGEDAFFTCFCPRCLKQMEASGYDGPRIRRAVRNLMEARAITDETALADWFAWRGRSIKNWFDVFSQAVHGLRREACAFVFAPSLAGFVGQTPEALRSLDIVSPMLYRAYPHEIGTAAMGHEWAAAQRMFGPVLPRLSALAGTTAPEKDASDGFPPERLQAEAAAARAATRLMPIVQIEDDRFTDSVREILASGADGFGAFMYGQAPIPNLRGL